MEKKEKLSNSKKRKKKFFNKNIFDRKFVALGSIIKIQFLPTTGFFLSSC